MKNDLPLQFNVIHQLTKKALNDFFDEIVKHRDEKNWRCCITPEVYKEYELAICEALHNIDMAEIYDALDNYRLITGEPCKEQVFRVCNDESEYEVSFPDGDKFTYDLWMDIITSFNKHMKHEHFYMTNESY